MNLDDDYRALLNKMAAKRAIERSLLFFVTVCVAGVGVLLFFQNRALTTEIKNQQTAATQSAHQAQANERALQQQSADIKQFIECIAAFFAQPDRADLTLKSLQHCQFATTSFSSTPTPSSIASSTVVPATPQTSNPNAQQPVVAGSPPEPTPSNPQPSPGNPQEPLPGGALQDVGDLVETITDQTGQLVNSFILH